MQFYSVLHIEDNPGDRVLFKEYLSQFSRFEVDLDQANSLEAGIERLNSKIYDLIVLDLGLPGRSGTESVEQLLEIDPDFNILVYSVDSREEIALKCIKLGANDYILKKETNPQSLEKTIAFAIERHELKKEQAHLKKALSREIKKLKDLDAEKGMYILKTDLEGKYTYYNHRFQETFLKGKTIDVIGKNSLMHIVEDDHAKTFETVEKCLMNPGVPQLVELRKPGFAPGTVLYTIWEFTALTDKQGTPIEILCTGYDISNQIQKNEKIRIQERINQIAFEYGSDLMLTLDQKLKIITCSPSSFDLFGHHNNQLVSQNLSSILKVEELELFQDFINDILEQGKTKTYRLQHHIMAKDGRSLEVQSNFRVYWDSANYPVIVMISRVLGFDLDVLSELNNIRNTHEALSKASHGAFVISDLKTGEIFEVNDRFCELFGHKAEDIIGRTSLEINLWPNEIARETALRKVIKAASSEKVQVELLDKKGKRIACLMHSQLVRHDKGDNRIVSTLLDNRILAEQIARLEEEKKQKEKVLSELQMTRTAINEHTIFMETDAEGIITYVNEIFCITSGYSKDELVGQSTRILNSGVHPKSFFKELWTTVKANKVWQGAVCNQKKNGENYWLDSTIIPGDIDAKGDPQRFLTIRTDITKLVEANDNLEISKTNLINTLNSAPHEIYAIDLEFKVVNLNRVFKENFKKDFGIELKPGDDIQNLEDFPKANLELWLKRLKLAFKGKKASYIDTFRSLGEDRRLVSKHIVISPTKNVKGRIVGANIFVEDISELESRNREIERLRINTQALVNSTKDHIWSVDLGYKLLSANQGFLDYWSDKLGQKTQVGDRIFNQSLEKSCIAKWKKIYEKAFGGEHSHALFEDFESTNSQIFSVNVYPIKNAKGLITGVACYSYDATERLTYLRMIERQNESLKEIAWLQSHVLRAPLARMLGLLELIKEDETKYNVDLVDYLKYVYESAQELDQVVHEITDKTAKFNLEEK